jgi:hypothetical protein
MKKARWLPDLPSVKLWTHYARTALPNVKVASAISAGFATPATTQAPAAPARHSRSRRAGRAGGGLDCRGEGRTTVEKVRDENEQGPHVSGLGVYCNSCKIMGEQRFESFGGLTGISSRGPC